MFMTPVNLAMTEDDMERKGNPNEDAYAFVRMLVADCMKAGQLRPELTDIDLVAQTLWAAVHGVAALEITACKGGWMEWCPLTQRIDLMLDGIYQGLMRDRPEGGAAVATSEDAPLEGRTGAAPEERQAGE